MVSNTDRKTCLRRSRPSGSEIEAWNRPPRAFDFGAVDTEAVESGAEGATDDETAEGSPTALADGPAGAVLGATETPEPDTEPVTFAPLVRPDKSLDGDTWVASHNPMRQEQLKLIDNNLQGDYSTAKSQTKQKGPHRSYRRCIRGLKRPQAGGGSRCW
jgi:hypothetical protein